MEKIKETLGERISRLRKTRRLSQEKFGELVRIPRRTLQDIEYDKVNTSADNIARIARFLEVSESYILHGIDVTEAPKVSSKAELLTEIYSIAPSLQEDQLKEILMKMRSFR